MIHTNPLDLIIPDWPAPGNVVSYTTTRSGGVSQGAYASLNVGAHVDDDPACVKTNRAKLPHAEKITWLNQIHSAHCIRLPGSLSEADAVISSHSGYFCAVMTADCVPILLCDETGSEVGAIHAGWQGLENGVIASTLKQLSKPVGGYMAWIGPAISGNCYEVNDSLAQRFSDFPNAICAHKDPRKAWLNLPDIAHQQLTAGGIRSVYRSNLCTYSDSQRFFSHRRATHEGEQVTGRMVSVIGII